jgi:hypothetical protein
LEVWAENEGASCADHENGDGREEGCSRLLVESLQHTVMSNTYH